MPDARHDEALLNRPVWGALTTGLSKLAPHGGDVRRFPPEIGPFVATVPGGLKAPASVVDVILPGETISMVEPDAPLAPANIDARQRDIVQMVQHEESSPPPCKHEISVLTDADADDMLALATLTRPGPFAERTHSLGRFIGVRAGGRLIAMGGERFHIGRYREASAICTHPDFQGQGLGRAILHAISKAIRERGEIPFLHSNADNTIAIGMYERMGFRVRTGLVHVMWARA